MSGSLYLCFAKGCHQKCRPSEFSALQSHQQTAHLEHKAIKVSRYQEKSAKFINTITKATLGLHLLMKSITDEAQKMIKHIQNARDSIINQIENEETAYFTSAKSSFNCRELMAELQRNDYSRLTCHNLKEIIRIIEGVIKKDEFVEEETRSNKAKENQFRQRFSLKLQQAFQSHKYCNSNLFDTSESSIQSIRRSILSKTEESLLSGLQDSDLSSNKHPFKKRVFREKSAEINEDDYNDSVNIYSQVKPRKTYHRKQVKPSLANGSESYNDINQYQDSLQSSLGLMTKQQNESSYSSSYLSVAFQSKVEQSLRKDEGRQEDMNGGASQDQDDDEEKLNKTLAEIETEIMCKQFPQEQVDSSFLTIKQIKEKLSEMTYFSTRVKIIKLLYYSVLEKHIPKIKFIAGDSTGYAVFFTNFCPGMKVGTCLSLINCTFHHYQQSIEIRNDKNFRLLPPDSNITVNMKGTRINTVITPDLYYPLPDKRCYLIRHVAQMLNRQRKIVYVTRMYVKVTAVIYTAKDRVFCQVGDSSGLMLAYLKQTHRMPKISEGDVVRLLQVKGVRGRGKSKQDFEGEDILYIDSEEEGAKVLPHRFDFLEVSDRVMTIE